MTRRPLLRFGFFVPMLAALLLVIAVACGGSATSTSAPQATAVLAAATAVPVAPAATTAAPVVGATARPTAVPVATAAPAATAVPSAVKAFGTLDSAEKEIGVYQGWPGEVGFPQFPYMVMTAFEGLWSADSKGAFFGRLAEDWSVSPDNRVWTIKIRDGVKYHDGVGEVTAGDVVWSLEGHAQKGSKGGHGPAQRKHFQNPAGYMVALDDRTVELDTGIPAWNLFFHSATPGSEGTFIVSEKQALELEAELGDRDTVNAQGALAGTGPWAKVETRTGEFWKFKANEDHYHKVPYFAELIVHEIPEESTRIANFQVGKIDVFAAAPDSLATLAEVEGTEFMSQLQAGEAFLNLYGQYYFHAGTPEAKDGYCPECAWVSSNPDINSPEWADAVKVRRAMSLAIDREKIVEELLHGEGAPATMKGWMGHDDQADPRWVWEYDLEQAQQLMNEAGWEDGFEIDVTPAIRGAAAEVEACEAIGDMWADIGITAHLQRLPYATLREGIYARNEKGMVCHTFGAGPSPLTWMVFQWYPDVGFSTGESHRILTSATGSVDEEPGLFETANDTFDDETRWELLRELGNFLWDNALSISVYSVNSTYALGPEVESWADNLSRGDPRRISSLEWAAHRQ